jgi:rRNA methylases
MVGVGPWVGEWPKGDHFDPELLENGDRRNVLDQYRYWTREAISRAISDQSLGFEVAIENLGHDFNIGSIVRTANALGAAAVHIVGKRRWNRRGAMVTDRYLPVGHFPDVDSFVKDAARRRKILVGIDILDVSTPLETAVLPGEAILVFGEEGGGLSERMLEECVAVHHVTQYGSTRSMNVGHAAAIAMWAWGRQNNNN